MIELKIQYVYLCVSRVHVFSQIHETYGTLSNTVAYVSHCIRTHACIRRELRNFSSSSTNYVMIDASSINQRDRIRAIYLSRPWASANGPVNESFSIRCRSGTVNKRSCLSIDIQTGSHSLGKFLACS